MTTTTQKRAIGAYLRARYEGGRNVRFGEDGGVSITVDRMPNTNARGRIFAGYVDDLLREAQPRCQSGSVFGQRCENAAEGEVLVMPDDLRAQHDAAGGGRVTEQNGGQRLMVCARCRAELLADLANYVAAA